MYVTDRSNFIRVVIDKPADEGIETSVENLIDRLNGLDENVFYKVMSISYHTVSNDQDPDFRKYVATSCSTMS